MKFQFEQSGPFIGMAGMATAFFLYGWSAVVLHDLVSLVVLPAVWLILFVLACFWFTRHPYRVMVLPVLAIAVWFAAVLA